MLVPARLPKMVAIEIGEQDAVELRDAPVGADQPGAAGDADQGADIVEQVDEQEDEQYLEQAEAVAARQAEHAGEIELEGGLADRGQVVGLGREGDHARDPPGHGGRGDADQDRAAHLPGRQRGGHHQPEQSERGAGRVQVAERHRGRRAGDDDPGILEADEGDEQADPARHRREQMRRDGGDDELADAGEGQQQEGEARDEDVAQSHRPGHAHHGRR